MVALCAADTKESCASQHTPDSLKETVLTRLEAKIDSLASALETHSTETRRTTEQLRAHFDKSLSAPVKAAPSSSGAISDDEALALASRLGIHIDLSEIDDTVSATCVPWF